MIIVGSVQDGTYVTMREMAAFLNLGYRTIQRYVSEGRIVSVKVGGKRYINKHESLVALGLLR